jgi:tryptophan synthase beta chain
MEFIGVESTAVPSFSKGEYRYEFPDTSGMLPKTKMYTLGKEFIPTKSHAVGLNYHGKGALLSLLVHQKVIKTRAYELERALKAARLFAQTEKIVVAPESSYAVKSAIDLALECKRKRQKKTIVFLVSGTGMMDAKAYAKMLEKKAVRNEEIL